MPERRPLDVADGPRAQPPTPVRAVAVASAGYPAGLRDLPRPPGHIYLRGGDLPALARAVAVVGSRAASDYGVDQARRLAADLARIGFVIVSGLARGIDAAAHRGALDAGGRTVAVIPSGLDAITPRHHRDLAETIAGRGTLLSERERGDPPGKRAFVERNRLIAALAAATVVVEAASVSGALTTAAWARRLGRAVLAVPGDVDRETTRGCHALIRQGAALCEQAADVVEAIEGRGARGGEPRAHRREARRAEAMPAFEQRPAEARLLDAIDEVPRTVDTLAAACGLAVPETLAALLTLQWAGMVDARPGQRWARRHG